MPFTILSIDDHGLFRTGIELIVKGAFGGVNFASFASLGQALETLTAAPEIILLDLHLAGIGGHDAIPLLKLRWPGSRIIVVTSVQDEAEIARALAAGGDLAILKSEAPERLIGAIRALAPHSRGIARSHPEAQPATDAPLTGRQLEVLRHLREGHSNKAIANRLGISEFTVRGHVQLILKLLHVSSRAQAVFEAQKAGIL
ncbi:response regulator transcription factor [Sphingomonas sp. KR3-1]|uniref:response regulator transcription factor n=1 Tax=Sphingomonas sp. KR3-1 TaxID=3156611 RepID=UPI0032B5FCEC